MLQDGVVQVLTRTWKGNLHGKEYHQKVENHLQRKYTQMEKQRPTIGALITHNGPFIHQQNVRD